MHVREVMNERSREKGKGEVEGRLLEGGTIMLSCVGTGSAFSPFLPLLLSFFLSAALIRFLPPFLSLWGLLRTASTNSNTLSVLRMISVIIYAKLRDHVVLSHSSLEVLLGYF